MEQLTPDDRSAALEKALDAVNCELALLRQHMDARFAGVDAQFVSLRISVDSQLESMRQSVEDGFIKARLEMQLYVNGEIDKLRTDLGEKIEAAKSHADRQFRWVLGLQVTTLLSVAALAARGLPG